MSKESRDYDTSRSYSEGVRDGQNGDYNLPHDKGAIGGLFSTQSKDEIADRDAYREGWNRGNNER